jgi:uncharacterized protein (TIGR02271 family)
VWIGGAVAAVFTETRRGCRRVHDGECIVCVAGGERRQVVTLDPGRKLLTLRVVNVPHTELPFGDNQRITTVTNTELDYEAWVGHHVIDIDGEKVGKIEALYRDDASGEPEWLAIKTGMFGSKHSFAPIAGASNAGDDLRLAFTKSQVLDAPKVDPDGHLEPAEEAELYRHYGREADYTATARKSDTNDAQSDDAMTRSEEQLKVDTRSREAGRARLVKHVVTEQVNVTVPVEHEEVRVEREPITDANRSDALEGAEITDAEHEMVLNAEEVVVTKNVVPQERVKLSKETVTEDQRVSDTVRKEQIDVDTPETS